MMNRNLVNKIAGLCLCLLLAAGLRSQTGFTYTAALQKVGQSGFYAIAVSPEIAAKANASLSDLRILDSSGRHVPFFFRNDLAISQLPVWIDFPIDAAGIGADKLYYYIVSNTAKRELDHLSLNFQNTAAKRLMDISGSDDRKQWFAIRESISLNANSGAIATSFVQDVDIPVSNCRYFRITLQGKGLTPVKLMKAGNLESGQVTSKWIVLPAPVITQKDSSDKHSYYRLVFDEPFSMDKLVIQFGGAPFFQRPMAVFTNDRFKSPLIATTTQSSLPVSVSIAQKLKQVWVVVDNKDNPPLQISTAKAYMLRKDIVTYLKEGHSYRISFGDTTLTNMPSYDIGLFQDSIPGKLPTVLPGPVQQIQIKGIAVKKEDKSSSWITWMAIGFMLVVLLITTMRLTGEVNKTKNTDT